MIGLALRFELGRYHANPWGAHVNEGTVEWPPSPWRILRGLYSVCFTHADLQRHRPQAERALARLMGDPTPTYTLPASTLAHTRHFMPSREWSPAAPGKTALVFDSFRALAPEDELVAWWRVDLSEPEYAALAEAVIRLGHLGRSESVCSARLLDRFDESVQIAARPADQTSVGEAVELLCPGPNATLEDLGVSITMLRRKRLAYPPAAQRITYAVEAPPPPRIRPPMKAVASPDLALFHLGGRRRPGIAEAVAAAQALRAALQRRYDPAREERRSSTLSGRDPAGARADQHLHAHYLALPGSDGRRIERLVAWAPEGFGSEEVRALASLSWLRVQPGGEPLPLALTALGCAGEMRFPELLGPGRHWRSLTPFGLVRHPKTRGGQLRDSPQDQVRLELRRRGLHEPESVELLRGSWHRFRSLRVGQSRLQRARVFGFTLSFPEPVLGPIVIGALCHFGLGVFTPIKDGR